MPKSLRSENGPEKQKHDSRNKKAELSFGYPGT